jgi:hypothetical protein
MDKHPLFLQQIAVPVAVRKGTTTQPPGKRGEGNCDDEEDFIFCSGDPHSFPLVANGWLEQIGYSSLDTHSFTPNI